MTLLRVIPLILLSACASQAPVLTPPGTLVTEARSDIVEVDVAALGDLSDTVIVDVREPAEFESGHIPGAINIPRGLLEFRIGGAAAGPDGAPDPGADILLYCRSGARGALAAQTLRKMGYTGVRNLAGGFLSWEAAERDVQKDP